MDPIHALLIVCLGMLLVACMLSTGRDNHKHEHAREPSCQDGTSAPSCRCCAVHVICGTRNIPFQLTVNLISPDCSMHWLCIFMTKTMLLGVWA